MPSACCEVLYLVGKTKRKVSANSGAQQNLDIKIRINRVRDIDDKNKMDRVQTSRKRTRTLIHDSD